MISQKYYIEFSKWFDDPARDIATSAVFKVYPDNISQAFSRNDFYFSIGITRTAYANQLYCLTDEHAYAKFLLKLSIEKIIAILKSTDLVELDKRFEFIYHSENLPNPQKLLQKNVNIRKKKLTGFIVWWLLTMIKLKGAQLYQFVKNASCLQKKLFVHIYAIP